MAHTVLLPREPVNTKSASLAKFVRPWSLADGWDGDWGGIGTVSKIFVPVSRPLDWTDCPCTKTPCLWRFSSSLPRAPGACNPRAPAKKRYAGVTRGLRGAYTPSKAAQPPRTGSIPDPRNPRVRGTRNPRVVGSEKKLGGLAPQADSCPRSSSKKERSIGRSSGINLSALW
jgi:hypothetical protein